MPRGPGDLEEFEDFSAFFVTVLRFDCAFGVCLPHPIHCLLRMVLWLWYPRSCCSLACCLRRCQGMVFFYTIHLHFNWWSMWGRVLWDGILLGCIYSNNLSVVCGGWFSCFSGLTPLPCMNAWEFVKGCKFFYVCMGFIYFVFDRALW